VFGITATRLVTGPEPATRRVALFVTVTRG
jgi:hypothetical protein